MYNKLNLDIFLLPFILDPRMSDFQLNDKTKIERKSAVLLVKSNFYSHYLSGKGKDSINKKGK